MSIVMIIGKSQSFLRARKKRHSSAMTSISLGPSNSIADSVYRMTLFLAPDFWRGKICYDPSPSP
jgi:hypothetical protein